MWTKKYLILVAWFKKTNFNAKFTGLATNSTLTAVKNNVPDVSSLVKKSDYVTKLNEIEKELMIIIMTNTLFNNLIL